jgi:hypothetical protein
MNQLTYNNLKQTDVDQDSFGISNCGNSCFFNSTNQMLFHIPEFREFLITNKKIFDNKEIDSSNIVLNLIELFILMKTKSGSINSTDNLHDKTLLEFYSNIQKKFYIDLGEPSDPYDNSGGYRTQRDASPLIEGYFYIIKEIIYDYFLLPKIIGQVFFRENIIKDLQINLPIFNLYIKSTKTISCLTNLTNNIESYNKEHIPLYNEEINGKTNFEINLKDKKNVLEASENHLNCANLDASGKKLKIQTKKNTRESIKYEPNEYIIIILKRFEFKLDGSSNKLSNPIENYNIINNTDNFYISDRDNNNFKLIGGILHTGSLNGGHYVYYHKMNNWKRYNDSETSELIPPNDLYILLFKREQATLPLLIYQNVILDIFIINDIILNNFNILINNFNFVNYNPLFNNTNKIQFYVKILVYYTSLYNQKSNKNYKPTLEPLILQITNTLKLKIKALLLTI